MALVSWTNLRWAATALLIALVAVMSTEPRFDIPPPGAIIVAGAGSGVGRHVVERLSWELPEHTIYGIVRRGTNATNIAGLGRNVQGLVADLTDRPSLHRAMRKVAEAGRPLVGLFDSAGVAVPNVPVEHLDVETMRDVYAVDVFGLVNLLQAALPLMLRRPPQGVGATGSRICLMGSVTGVVTPAFMGADPARAIETIADALRREVKPTGIAVSVIQAGFVQSPIIQKTHEADRKLHEHLEDGTNLRGMYPGLARKDYEEQLPYERMGSIAAVADAVLHAFTEEQPRIRYVVGATPVLPASILVPLLQLLPHHVVDWFE